MNSLMQWNLNGFYNKLTDLKLFVNNKKPNIICLQETNLKQTIMQKLKTTMVSSRSDKQTRTVLVGE